MLPTDTDDRTPTQKYTHTKDEGRKISLSRHDLSSKMFSLDFPNERENFPHMKFFFIGFSPTEPNFAWLQRLRVGGGWINWTCLHIKGYRVTLILWKSNPINFNRTKRGRADAREDNEWIRILNLSRCSFWGDRMKILLSVLYKCEWLRLCIFENFFFFNEVGCGIDWFSCTKSVFKMQWSLFIKGYLRFSNINCCTKIL